VLEQVIMMQFTSSLYSLFRMRRAELRSHLDKKHVANLKEEIAKEREQAKIKAKSKSTTIPSEPEVSTFFA